MSHLLRAPSEWIQTQMHTVRSALNVTMPIAFFSIQKTTRKVCCFILRIPKMKAFCSIHQVVTKHDVPIRCLDPYHIFWDSKAWKKASLLVDCSTRRLDRVAALFKEGVTKISYGNAGQLRQTSKTADAIAWMDSYFRMIREQVPNCDRIHLLFLPSRMCMNGW